MRWLFCLYFSIAVVFFIVVELAMAGLVIVGLDATTFVGNPLFIRLTGLATVLFVGGVWLKMGILFSLRPSHFRDLYFKLLKAMIEAKIEQIFRKQNHSKEETK